MEGLTTALVAFVFVCIIFPRVVRNRSQFYWAVGLVTLMILLQALAIIFAFSGGFGHFLISVASLASVAAFLLMVLACNGLSLKDLSGELKDAIEVMRRGDTEKTILVPKPQGGYAGKKNEEPERQVYVIDEPSVAATPAAAAPAQEPAAPVEPEKKDDSGSIPLV